MTVTSQRTLQRGIKTFPVNKKRCRKLCLASVARPVPALKHAHSSVLLCYHVNLK